MAGSFSPKYLKAKLSFIHNSENYDLGEQLINIYGLERVEWSHSDPREMVGQITQVKVTVQSKRTFAFECVANFTSEQNELLVYLGLSFVLPLEVEQILSKIIDEEGSLPEYIRKFPRIVFTEKNNIMPEYAILSYSLGDQDVAVVCKVLNMSPSGFRLSSEDSRLMSILPATDVDIQFSPRGNFSNPVNLQAVIRGVTQAAVVNSGNLSWKLGLEIKGISEPDRGYFKELLRLIVENIRKA